MAKRLILVMALAMAALVGGVLLGFDPQATFAQAAPGNGLRAEILNVQIPADRKPVVTFRLTNAAGAPLALADMDANSVRFIMTHLRTDPQSGRGELLSYTVNQVTGRPFTFEGESFQPAVARAPQAVYDPIGVFTRLADGSYSYQFSTALPQGFDVDAVHRLGMQATRNARGWVANDVFDFRPNGQVAQQIATVANESCNKCHDLLTAHGGQRYLTELCVTCHTSQTIDPETNRTQDFKVLVHKIHRGENLPSVQAGESYVIVGYRQSPHDYSEVVLPQDIRNCTSCHNGPRADAWKTNPSAAACGSCHDGVNFETGAGHLAGAQPDSACATCHTAEGPEFGISVAGAHTIPTQSAQLRGVTFEMLRVRNAAPGQQPIVSFNIKDRNGAQIAATDMNRLAFTLAGPTYEYQMFWNESALGNVNVVGDHYEFTFPRALPAFAGDSWTMQIEGYINAQLQDASGRVLAGPTGSPLVVRDAGFDQSIDFAVGGNLVLPRKQIVDGNSCNDCHKNLSLHGGNRQNVENCVLCHNPRRTDEAVRPAAAMPPETIDFKVLVHKIHTGEHLNQKPYIVYGRASSVHQYDEVRYPTDRRNCGNCHVPQSNLADFVHQGALNVNVTQAGQLVSSTPPTAAACTSCHDSALAIAHATANTTADGRETCVLCHGEGRQSPVSANHAVRFPVLDFPR